MKSTVRRALQRMLEPHTNTIIYTRNTNLTVILAHV